MHKYFPEDVNLAFLSLVIARRTARQSLVLGARSVRGGAPMLGGSRIS